jgi:tripeptide aminopeptidase
MDQQKLLDLFLTLVKIDSVSRHERAVADFLTKKFNQWNIDVLEDQAAGEVNGSAGNLIIRIPGVHDSRPPILLLAHMDTVKSTALVQPKLENGVFHSDGTTILGADNRAGVAIILRAIEEIIERKLKHRNLEIVFTIAEELGMLGALALDFSALSSREGYVFDCTSVPGGYVTTTPTAIDFQVHCQGRPAHSAVAPEKGVNALSMALQVMNKFPVGRVNEQTVANIGTIHGGSADNVVPDRVDITGEFRSFSAEEIKRIQTSLESECLAVGKKWGGQCEPSFKPSFEGFRFEPSMPQVSHLLDAFDKVGVKPNPMVYYGGSDANVFNARGISTINIGIGANNPHSNEEQIALADMAKGVEILMHLIEAESK